MYGKLENGRLKYAPNVLHIDGITHINPSEAFLKSQGYFPIKFTNQPTSNDFEPIYTIENDMIIQSWQEVINVEKLEELKTLKIKESKETLANYLLNNPIFSTCKYKEGRYYTATSEKQNQLTSKLAMAQLYVQLGLPYELKWNDTGNICENWELSELIQLAMEMDAFVTPLVTLQQTFEKNVNECDSLDSVKSMNFKVLSND